MPRHCPGCGTGLVDRRVEGRTRRYCPGCDSVAYRNPKPCAGVLVLDGDQVLLVKRGEPPSPGSWSAPAGFMEADEPPRRAATRELREETGVTVDPAHLALHDTVFKESHLDHHSLILLYTAPRSRADGDPDPGTDADAARYVDRDEIPRLDLEPGFRGAIEDAVRWHSDS